MLRRLGIGALKGLILGGGIGAGLHFGLHWTWLDGLLGFLVAMAAAGTTGVFAGKAPWREGAWIEAFLKGMVGVGLGALAYWGLTYVPWEVPFPDVAGTAPLAELPMVFAPLIAATYGGLVELDNTGPRGGGDKATSAKARVDAEDLDLDLEGERPRKRRRRKAAATD
ncbi:MAG: hypothetical protein ACFCGT_16305 [Sandaracinaceae bacterium]